MSDGLQQAVEMQEKEGKNKIPSADSEGDQRIGEGKGEEEEDTNL